MKTRIGLIVLIALLSGNPCPAASSLPPSFSEGLLPSSPWVHRDSGFVFHEKVAGFMRGNAHQFDEAGQDVSVGYYFYHPNIVATFYVYPTGGLTLEQELSRRESEVTDKYPDAKLVSTGTTTVGPKGDPAIIATYAIPEMFDQPNQPKQSLLLIGQRGDWFVEYRISYDVSAGQVAVDAAQRFLKEFAWP